MDEAKGEDLEKKMRLREEKGNNESSIHLLRKRLYLQVYKCGDAGARRDNVPREAPARP